LQKTHPSKSKATKKTSKKAKKNQHVLDVPSGDVFGDEIGSNTNLSTPIPEILELVSFFCLLCIDYVTDGN
jgi:hypothetical protein